jgi:hypothetical protein
MWPFDSRKLPEPCCAVGQYRLGASIDGLNGIVHLSPYEIALLNPEPVFDGEEIWNCPDAEFLGRMWRTIIASVNQVIYKVSIQSDGSRHQAGMACREIAIYCTKHYGKQHDVNVKGRSLTVWDTSDGNIVLEMAAGESTALLNLTFTSNDVANFKCSSAKVEDSSQRFTLSGIENLLTVAIFKRLLIKYEPCFGDQTNLLAANILNFALVRVPEGSDAIRYATENHALIEQQATMICRDDVLAHALGTLYAVMLIRLGPTDLERSNALTGRACELLIDIRTPEELCETEDIFDLLRNLEEYVQSLWGEPHRPIEPKGP